MSGVFAIISEKENSIEDAIGTAEHMTEGLAAYGSADSGYEILGAAGKQLILGSCISGMHREVPAGKPGLGFYRTYTESRLLSGGEYLLSSS